MHPIIRDIVVKVFSKLGFSSNKALLFINPIIVFMICFLISALIYLIIDQINNRRIRERKYVRLFSSRRGIIWKYFRI